MKIETSGIATKIDFDSYEVEEGQVQVGEQTFEASKVVGVDNG